MIARGEQQREDAPVLAAVLFALTTSLPLAAGPRLLVLDLEVHGSDPSLVHGTTNILVDELAQSRRFEVLAGDDVRRALALEATRQENGCTGESCLGEIAGAMDASFVVFGALDRIGDQDLLTLNLFDSAAVRSIARTTGELPPRKAGAQAMRDAVAGQARALVKQYDAQRGVFPVHVAVGAVGAAAATAGLVGVGVGVWQLLALSQDAERHDRLLADYEEKREPALVDDAVAVQQSADRHALFATLALLAGAPMLVAGIAGAGYGVYGALE